jgi:lipopolysaccharide transport system ATP-binding protein
LITFHNISKQYRLGLVSTRTLSHDLNRWWQVNVRGKEDPYLKIGESNDRSKRGESEYVWALKDINFEVQQGEVLGIIGKNGAGKSTLLKILSKVTTPTTGTITARGRIASLLEVGTGFHPEMTGRENIYMNGCIMGMSKSEITSKLDEIVDFSGVERYLDTPVKRYSSGMMVRLGFAVAAHLEPEILVVDEVLAVGDAEFQKKAIGKMQEVSGKNGRTVLFVSHNMGAVQSLCQNGIILENGCIKYYGHIENAISQYSNYDNQLNTENFKTVTDRQGNMKVYLSELKIISRNRQTNNIFTGDDLKIIFVITSSKKNTKKVDVGFSIHNSLGRRVTLLYSSFNNKLFNFSEIGSNTVSFKLENIFFTPGKYYISTRILENGIESDWIKEKIFLFNVEMGDFYKTGQTGIYEKTDFLITGAWDMEY